MDRKKIDTDKIDPRIIEILLDTAQNKRNLDKLHNDAVKHYRRNALFCPKLPQLNTAFNHANDFYADIISVLEDVGDASDLQAIYNAQNLCVAYGDSVKKHCFQAIDILNDCRKNKVSRYLALMFK